MRGVKERRELAIRIVKSIARREPTLGKSLNHVSMKRGQAPEVGDKCRNADTELTRNKGERGGVTDHIS